MKSVQNKSETTSRVKDLENVKVIQQESLTYHIVKDHKKNKDSEMGKEKDKETKNISKPQFKCPTCGARFKKEITMNKH